MADLTFDCGTTGLVTEVPEHVGAGTVTVYSGTGVVTISGAHEDLDTLVHNLSEDTYTDIVRAAGGKVSEVNTYTELGGTEVRTTAIARNAEGRVIQVVENQHNPSGTIIQTLTTTITRTAGKVSSIETEEVQSPDVV
jgi:hypothetical protein